LKRHITKKGHYLDDLYYAMKHSPGPAAYKIKDGWSVPPT